MGLSRLEQVRQGSKVRLANAKRTPMRMAAWKSVG